MNVKTIKINAAIFPKVIQIILGKPQPQKAVNDDVDAQHIEPDLIIDLPRSAYLTYLQSMASEGSSTELELLKKYNFEKYFIDSANAANGKTKAENIRYIVEKHNLINPVYVGDTIKDYQSSNEANVPFIHASYGFGKVECEVLAVRQPHNGSYGVQGVQAAEEDIGDKDLGVRKAGRTQR